MAIFDRMFDGRKDVGVLTSIPDFMMWGNPVKSGQTVNYMTALQVAAVLAVCQVRCNGVAQVPWEVRRARPDGRGSDAATKHALYRLLHRKPNDYQTSFEFRQTVELHLTLARNAFVFISRGAGGRILELIPLEPGRVSVTRHQDLSLTYTVNAEEGGGTKNLAAEHIWHLKGLSWNGWIGMEAVKLARESIGLSLALEEAHSRLHANAAQPSGTFSVEGKLNDDQHNKLAGWIKKHAAAENKGSPLVLDNGAKWLSQQMSGVDAQHIETRKHQVLEICRMGNVQPIMIHAVDKPTYGSAEQTFNAHHVHCLAPEYEMIEQSADVYLLGDKDMDDGYYVAFNPRGMLRGSMKDQGEYYSKALGAGGSKGWMTQDEVRDETDMNPKGGQADELPQPTNVAAKAPGQSQDKPDPEPEPSEDEDED